MVRVPGNWKNFDDLEEHISLDEMQAMLEKAREIERDNAKFLAGLQGIDLEKNSAQSEEERFNEVKRRAIAKNAGVSEEVVEFAEIGISFNEE